MPSKLIDVKLIATFREADGQTRIATIKLSDPVVLLESGNTFTTHNGAGALMIKFSRAMLIKTVVPRVM